MTALGTDLSCTKDLDPALSQVSGRDALGQSIVRAITTPAGGLWYAPDYGFDVRSLLGEDVTQSDLSRAESAIAEQVRADDRVADVRVRLTSSAGAREVSIEIRGSTVDGGPFEYVITAAEAAVTLV